MVDEFFLQSLIQITHGEIRLIDNDRKIRRIGQTNEDEDPFFTYPNFLNDVLERRPEASIDVFWEDDVYYTKGAVSCPLYPPHKNAFNTQSSECFLPFHLQALLCHSFLNRQTNRLNLKCTKLKL